MDSGCYVLVDHPYLDPAPVFGPYESRQEAVENFGGWSKAITAATMHTGDLDRPARTVIAKN